MKEYSDTTQEVFKLIINILESELHPHALQKVQEAIEGGTFGNVNEVLNAIEEAMSGPGDNANS